MINPFKDANIRVSSTEGKMYVSRGGTADFVRVTVNTADLDVFVPACSLSLP